MGAGAASVWDDLGTDDGRNGHDAHDGRNSRHVHHARYAHDARHAHHPSAPGPDASAASQGRFSARDASASQPTISRTPAPAVPRLKAAQAKANAATSRRLRETASAVPEAIGGGIAGILAKAAGAAAGVVSAAAMQAAVILLPLALPLLLVLALATSLPTCAATLTLFPQGSGGALIARTALAEYREGEARGHNQHGNAKYWDYVFGGGFSDGNSTPWCACFVSWCADSCGLVEDGIVPRLGGCGGFLSWYAMNPAAGTVFHGFEGWFPQVGDLIIYNSTGGPRYGHDHIGIIVSVQGDGSFETVEGNTYAAHSGVCGTGANHCGLHYHQKVGDSWPSADRTGNGRGGGEPSFIRPAYPSGTGVIEVPELSSGTCPAGHTFENVRVGTYATREWDLGTNDFAAGTAQARVEALWESAGAVTDPRGFNMLDGCYLIACTSVFGDVGDRITFAFDDGTEIECVKIDAKAETVAPHDPHPATRWGHSHDANVLEFCGTSAIGDNPYGALGLEGRHVVSATNHGSIL